MRTLTVILISILISFPSRGSAQSNKRIDTLGVSVWHQTEHKESAVLYMTDHEVKAGDVDQTTFTVVQWKGSDRDTLIYTITPGMVKLKWNTIDEVYPNQWVAVLGFRCVHLYTIEKITTIDRKRDVLLLVNATPKLQ